MTGRPEGDFTYVVHSEGEHSEPCTVAVSPPSLELAFGLFIVGLVVFAATLMVIVRGNRDAKESE